MRNQRQRTLHEFSGSPPPMNNSSPIKGKGRSLEINSDDSASDPGLIKFESEASSNKQVAVKDDELSAACHPSHIQETLSMSIISSRSTSSEREIVPKKSSTSLTGARRLVITSDESDNQRPTKKRRLMKGKRYASPSEEAENEDLVNEIDKDRILESRLRARPKKTDFVRNLERLQRRRRGVASPSENEESENDSDDSGSSSLYDISFRAFKGARPTIENESDRIEVVSEDEDDDFIIHDDDDGDVPELPAMFNMGTYQDLSHHFKVICQLFVHLTVKDPRKRRRFMEQEMQKDYFSIPLAITRRKFSAMKDSLVTSSIWKPDFKAPLESLPNFRLERLDFSIPLCDACRIGSRVATLRGVVSGPRYDRLTFEPLEGNVNDEEESNEVEWSLGRFCAARAQVFHLFSHWEYILYQSLREEVQIFQEALSSSKADMPQVFLPHTKGPPPPDDPDDADGIMDWLDGRGIINMQWANVRNMMDRARRLEGRKEAEEHIDVQPI